MYSTIQACREITKQMQGLRVTAGVRQGDYLSPTLFNVVTNDALEARAGAAVPARRRQHQACSLGNIPCIGRRWLKNDDMLFQHRMFQHRWVRFAIFLRIQNNSYCHVKLTTKSLKLESYLHPQLGRFASKYPKSILGQPILY